MFKLYYNGELIDTTGTQTEAEYLQREYAIAFHCDESEIIVTIAF